MNSISTPIQCTNVYTNGRDIVRITIPTQLILAFASLLYAQIMCGDSLRRKRRGSASIDANCISGMGGQIAVLFWLRHIGLSAQMLLPSAGPDSGYDLVCDGGMLKVEVKTLSFSDGRSFDAMTRGERLPMSKDRHPSPDFYFFAVVNPDVAQPSASTFDLAVTLPAGATQPWTKPFTAPAGMRLCDVSPMFSPRWFAEQFPLTDHAAVTDVDLPDGPEAAIAWGVAQGLLKAEGAVTDVGAMEIAQRAFDRWATGNAA